MKAVIMEIYKDYCIVMTRDGQFLKQRIPAGVFEIGDEITVSEEYTFKPVRVNLNIGWIRNAAVTASVVVIVIAGSIFGVWYLRHYSASRSLASFTEDTTTQEMIIGEEAAEEEKKESTQEEPSMAMAAEEEAIEAITFEKTYSIEEQAEVEEDIEEIIRFSYKVIDGVNLRIKLKNISSTLSFNGTIRLVMFLSDETESRTEIISLEGFGPGKIKEHPLFLKAGETKLKLEVNGSTY